MNSRKKNLTLKVHSFGFPLIDHHSPQKIDSMKAVGNKWMEHFSPDSRFISWTHCKDTNINHENPMFVWI